MRIHLDFFANYIDVDVDFIAGKKRIRRPSSPYLCFGYFFYKRD